MAHSKTPQVRNNVLTAITHRALRTIDHSAHDHDAMAALLIAGNPVLTMRCDLSRDPTFAELTTRNRCKERRQPEQHHALPGAPGHGRVS